MLSATGDLFYLAASSGTQLVATAPLSSTINCGPAGDRAFLDVAVDSSGQLYGVANTSSSSCALYTINPQTGASSFSSTISSSRKDVNALEFAGSTLYAAHSSGILYQLNGSSWSQVGTLNGSTGDLAYHASTNRLYYVDSDSHLEYYSISAGTTTEVGAIGYGSIYAMDFAADGTLYAISSQSSSPVLLQINLSTGAGTLKQTYASTLGQVWGLAAMTATIDVTPSVTSGLTTTEAGGTDTFTLSLSTQPLDNVTVALSSSDTSEGTVSPSSVVFTTDNWSTPQTVTVTGVDDALSDGDVTYKVITGSAVSGDARYNGLAVSDVSVSNADDDPALVAFSVSSKSVSESSGSISVAVCLVGAAPSSTVTVPFTVSGTATSGADYVISSSPVTFAPGQTTATITIDVLEDAAYESSETVVLSLGTPSGANLGSPTTYTLSITDNDAMPTVQFTASAQSATENAGTLALTVQMSGISGNNVVVPFTLGGTATVNTDYSITTTPVTIWAGTTSTTINVQISPDTLDEDNETVIVTLGTPTGATLGATTTQTVTLIDDDAAPTVAFMLASGSPSENAGALGITVALSAVSGWDVTVPFEVGGTATAGADYTISSSPVTIPAGSTTATITVTLIDDTSYEHDEAIAIALGTPTNATLGAQKVHTLLIVDNDPLPTVNFTLATQEAVENLGALSIVVELSAPSVQNVTVPFAATGTAIGRGTDYTLTASPVTIPAGSTTATITLTMIDDALLEANETVILTMATPSQATLGEQTTHTVTILDNDVPPTVAFITDEQHSFENSETFIVTVQLSAVSGLDTEVPFAVTGTADGDAVDYTIDASPLIIPAGATTGTITITVINESQYEYDETVILTLLTPVNATLGDTLTDTVTILNDDYAPTVQFMAENRSDEEGTAFTITVQLSSISGVPMSVPFTISGTAENGTDYSIDAGPFSIAAGVSTASINVYSEDDLLDENDETVVVTLGTPTHATLGMTTTCTVTILDNDEPPAVQFSTGEVRWAESAGIVSLTVQLSAPSGLPITVPFTVGGTATSGLDYAASASPLSIPAGATSGTISVSLRRDDLDEPNETVVFILDTPTNATLGSIVAETLTIINAPIAQVTTLAQSGAERGTMTFTVALSAASMLPITLPFTLSGTAALGEDYTISPASPITLAADATSATVTITVVDETLYERDEKIVFTLGTPTNAFLGAMTTHTLTIENDDDPPEVQFDRSSQSYCESDGTVTVAVWLSEVSGTDVVVPFSLSGTAVNGNDYTVSSSPLTIPAGDRWGEITLTLKPDLVNEGDETVILTLGTPIDATLGSTTTFTATLINAPVVSFTTSSVSVGEDSGQVTVTAQLSTISSLLITLPLLVTGTATDGSDYTIDTHAIIIPAGAQMGSITLTVTEDALYEADETVTVTLDTPTNAVLGTETSCTVTILNNDSPPTVQFVGTSATCWEYIGEATVTIRLSAESGLPITLPFTLSGTATAGVDYTVDASPIVIPAGTSWATFTIAITEDALDEKNETMVITLGTPEGATLGTAQVYTLTITDNDPTPTVQFTAARQSTAEGAGTITITVALSAASGLPISVPFSVAGTASAGTDYTISGSPITIAAGETTATITLTLFDDGLIEPDETVIVTLGTPLNALLGTTVVHTATILGDGSGPTTIGLYDPSSSFFFLRCSNTSGVADYNFGFGAAGGGWIVLEGDWNGDGVDGVGLYDPASSAFYLTNAFQTGYADYTFAYGVAGGGWLPIVGDWDGNGSVGVGLYDPATSMFYLTNTLETGYAEYTFGYGVPGGGWKPLVGDWDGNGSAGVGLYDPVNSTFYLTNTLEAGYAEHTFGYGVPNGGWVPMVGDWDGDGAAGVGLFDSSASTFYLTSAFVDGYAEYTFGYGAPDAGWTALVGDWNGNGAHGVGLYDPNDATFYLTNTLTGGYAEYTLGFGAPGAGWVPVVGYWGETSAASSAKAISAAAVDQLDLSRVVDEELSRDSTSDAALDELDWVLTNGI
jgi:hypothetical protein